MCLFVHTELLCACKYTQSIAQKAGLYSVARLKMDLPFHNRLAFTGEVPALFLRPSVARSSLAASTTNASSQEVVRQCLVTVPVG